MEQLLDFILEEFDSPQLEMMSLHKKPASTFCGNSNKEPSFNIILSGWLPSPKSPLGCPSFIYETRSHPQPSPTSWFRILNPSSNHLAFATKDEGGSSSPPRETSLLPSNLAALANRASLVPKDLSSRLRNHSFVMGSTQISSMLSFSPNIWECWSPFSQMALSKALEPTLACPPKILSRLSLNLISLG